MNKTDFYNSKITSNKTKYLEVQKKKLITLITKDHNFFLGRIYLMMNLKTRYQTTLKKRIYNSKLKPLG